MTTCGRMEKSPPLMAGPGHGLSLSGSAGSGSATRTAGPRPSKHPRPAVVLLQGATNIVIRCAQISAFVDYCSLFVHLQRQGVCLENASQRCCAGGLGRSASSIGAVRSQGGSAHA